MLDLAFGVALACGAGLACGAAWAWGAGATDRLQDGRDWDVERRRMVETQLRARETIGSISGGVPARLNIRALSDPPRRRPRGTAQISRPISRRL